MYVVLGLFGYWFIGRCLAVAVFRHKVANGSYHCYARDEAAWVGLLWPCWLIGLILASILKAFRP